MPVQKYNYEKLKQEFLASEFTEVKAFLLDKGLTYSGYWRDKTKGRRRDKREYNKLVGQRAIEKSIDREAKKLSAEIDLAKLVAMKNKLFDAIDEAIEQIQNSKKKSARDIDTYTKLIKTELGEPSTISKSDNTNTNVEELSDVDKEILDKFLNGLS